MGRRRAVALLWLCVALGWVVSEGASARDLEEVEAVGAVGLGPHVTGSPRDAAVRAALREAVHRTARALAATSGSAPSEIALDEILGGDPYEFASRFQVIEDRGEGPALFVTAPGFTREYVVIVNASIDRDLVRERLAAAGLLLSPSGESAQFRFRLDLESLDDYTAYEEIRRALIVDLGLRSAIPVEVEQGRLTLDVEADRPPSQLLGPLQSAVANRLELIPVSVGPDAMSLRVVVHPSAVGKIGSPESGPFDTRSPNRY